MQNKLKDIKYIKRENILNLFMYRMHKLLSPSLKKREQELTLDEYATASGFWSTTFLNCSTPLHLSLHSLDTRSDSMDWKSTADGSSERGSWERFLDPDELGAGGTPPCNPSPLLLITYNFIRL